MRKALALTVGALGIALCAWLAALREPGALWLPETPGASTGNARPAAQSALAPEDNASAAWSALQPAAPPARASDAEPPSRPAAPTALPDASADRDYGFHGRLGSALERYRKARTLVEREGPLLDLALSDEPAVLEFLLEELYRSNPANRQQVLDALMQYGSRDAIPELRSLAARPDAPPAERQALLETADYLALPTYTEYRRERAARRARSK